MFYMPSQLMCEVPQTDLNCEGKWLMELFYRPFHAFALFLSETESSNSWTFQRQIAPCYGEQLTRRAHSAPKIWDLQLFSEMTL